MAANEKYLTQSETPFIKGEGDNSAKLKPNPYVPDETYNIASGDHSVAEGMCRNAVGKCSHAEGRGRSGYDYSMYDPEIISARKLTAAEIAGINSEYMDENEPFSGDNVYLLDDAWMDFRMCFFTQSSSSSSAYARVIKSVYDGGQMLGRWYACVVQTDVALPGITSTTSLGNAYYIPLQDGALDDYSHAEGLDTNARGFASHAEGRGTIASGQYSHSEGNNTRANGDGSHAGGLSDTENGILATGRGSFAHGRSNSSNGIWASGTGSVAIGLSELVSYGIYAGGGGAIAMGTAQEQYGITAENAGSIAMGYSRAKYGITASGTGSVAMGYSNTNSGITASGTGSVAMGTAVTGKLEAKGNYGAVAMGDGAAASGQTSIALGKGVVALRNGSVALGEFNRYDSLTQFSYGNGTAIGNRRNLIELRNDKFYVKGIGGYDGTNASASTTSSLTDAMVFVPGSGEHSAVQNVDNIRYAGDYAVAEGAALAYGDYSHAEGQSIDSYEYVGSYNVRKLTEDEIDNFNDRYSTTFSGTVYLAEDANTDFHESNWVVYDNGVAEELIAFIPKSAIDWVGVTGNWYGTVFTTTAPISAVTSTTTTVSVDFARILYGALGSYSHAEGRNTKASGQYSHAEGYYTTANGDSSHAEGWYTRANWDYSHAEGFKASAQTLFTHAEGRETYANGNGAHAEGYGTRALGEYSHTEGYYTKTSQNRAEHAEGSYNATNYKTGSFGNSGNTIHSVGIGTADNNRKNAFEIMQNGDIYAYGVGGYNGANATATTSYTLQESLVPGRYKPAKSAGSDVELYCVNGNLVFYVTGATTSGQYIMTASNFYEAYMRSIGGYTTARRAMSDANKVIELAYLIGGAKIIQLPASSGQQATQFSTSYFLVAGSTGSPTTFTYGVSSTKTRLVVGNSGPVTFYYAL